MQINQVTVQIPLGELPAKQGYALQQELQGKIVVHETRLSLLLTAEMSEMFVRLREGLIATRATIPDSTSRAIVDRPIMSNADVLRWLLLQLIAAESAGQPIEQLLTQQPQTQPQQERQSILTAAPSKPNGRTALQEKLGT